MDTLLDQQPTMLRTKKFLNKYGMKSSYLAKKSRIPVSYLSRFINSHIPLYEPQHERLTKFMNEWDRRMVGFAALDD